MECYTSKQTHNLRKHKHAWKALRMWALLSDHLLFLRLMALQSYTAN